MNKKIAVIGASESCCGIIRTIREMGHQAIVISDSKNMPGEKIADFYLYIKYEDINAIAKYCQSVGVDAIVPTPVDRTLVLTAKVAEKLGLPFLPIGVADTFRNKYKMKQCFFNEGIPTARSIVSSDNDFSTDLSKNILYPLIIKPIDGYASRGVQKADNLNQLISFMREAASFSSNGQVLIEEFIEGREFNAEGVCFKGDVEIYAIVEKIRDPFPRTIEMGHIVPPLVSAKEEEIIVKTITNAVKALSMENGVFNAEIKLDNGIGYVIEVNGRPAGDFIISHLLLPTTGQDMLKAIVNVSLGVAPEKARRDYQRHGIISFFNLPAGKKIKKINDITYLNQNPAVIWAHLFFKEEEAIPEVFHMGHRSGFVIVVADSRKEMFDLAKRTKQEVISAIEYF